jgi:hypothetical protein
VDGEPGKGEARDVHLLDRLPGVLEPIDGRLGDELQACGPHLFEERAKGHVLTRGELLQVGERKAGYRRAARGADRGADPLDRGGARRRGAHDANFPCGGRHDDPDGRVGGNIGHAHERGARPVAFAARVVGAHAELDDVVAVYEGREFCVGHRHSSP